MKVSLIALVAACAVASALADTPQTNPPHLVRLDTPQTNPPHHI